jgi:hypothetical protein
MKSGYLALSAAFVIGVTPQASASAPAPAAAATPGAPNPAADPQVTTAVEKSRAYLRTLRSFEVRAFATMQDVLDNGAKVDSTQRVRYEYRAPDRLFIAWQSDNGERRLYYNGRTLAVFSSQTGDYAQIKATGSVSNLLQRLSTEYGIVYPLPDLFLWAASDAPAYNVQSATFIGPARIAEADTDHYLFRQQDVDWQLWLQRGDKPVPRKIVITDRSNPAQPSFSAMLQWNPDVQLTDDRFEFAPPADATQIDMATMSQEKGQ